MKRKSVTAKRKSQFKKMEVSKMKIKELIKSLVPLFISLIITVISYFAAFAITVIAGLTEVSNAEGASVNEGIFNLLRFTLMITFGGIWLYNISKIDTDENHFIPSFSFKFKPLVYILLVILGFSIQISTDSVLYIISKSAPDLFKSYHKMMETFTGNISPLFLITVIILGPIAEEIIFRGLTMHYAEKITGSLGVAIILQGVLFGLYHGTIVQGIYATIFGIMLGVICVRSRSLFPSIFLHMIINGSLYLIPEKLFVNIPVAVTLIIFTVAVMITSLLLVLPRIQYTQSKK